MRPPFSPARTNGGFLRRRGRTAAWRVAALAGGLAALALIGCGGTDESESRETTLRPAPSRGPSRLDAAWGGVVVVPAASLPLRRPGMIDMAEVRARTDDGQPVEVRWRMLRVTPGASPAMPPTGRRGWMPPVGVWSTAPVTAPGEKPELLSEGTLAAEFAVLILPQGTLGQGVWMEGSGVAGDAAGVRLEVNWLPSSVSLAERSGGWMSQAALSAEEAASPLVRTALEDETTSPFRRWRARLARGLLAPSDGARATGEAGPAGEEAGADAFADPVLEEIAAQIEERWTVALALLAEADAGWAARVRRALVLTAPRAESRAGSGAAAGQETLPAFPVWTTDQGALEELLGGLLAPRATRSMRIAAAEAFLRPLPEAVARVADDAHALDAATLAPVVALTVTNLTERPLAASAVWPRTMTMPDLSPVAARSGATLVLPTGPDAIAARPMVASVVVGDWRGRLAASPVATGVIPPGLFLGPMVVDLSKDEWLAGVSAPAASAAPLPSASSSESSSSAGAFASAPSRSPPVAVTILRTPSPSPRDRSDAEGWVLYGESAPGVEGIVRVWFGAAAGGRPPVLVAVGVGAATPPPTPASSGGAGESPGLGAGIAVKRTFSIPVPPEAVTRGRLLIGIDASVSVQGRDSHWAWPRAMFPWQEFPSRAALDLTAWGGVGGGVGSGVGAGVGESR